MSATDQITEVYGPQRFHDPCTFEDTVTLPTGIINSTHLATAPEFPASAMAQRNFQLFTIELESLRVFDAPQTILPAAAASDDMGYTKGTFGTHSPTVDAGDVGGTTSKRYARFFFRLPDNYVAGQSCDIRIRGTILTTNPDTTCNLDVVAHLADTNGGVGSDICTTATQNMLAAGAGTVANYDFIITPTGADPGDLLDIQISIDYVDSGDAGVMTPEVSHIWMRIDTRG
jgi:hypothetical protein